MAREAGLERRRIGNADAIPAGRNFFDEWQFVMPIRQHFGGNGLARRATIAVRREDDHATGERPAEKVDRAFDGRRGLRLRAAATGHEPHHEYRD